MKSAFAEKLGSLRRDKAISQRRVAEELGVSQALLSHYENGAREPKLEFVVRACDYYSVPADYILGRNSERRSGESQLSRAVSDIVIALEGLNLLETDLITQLKQITVSNHQTTNLSGQRGKRNNKTQK